MLEGSPAPATMNDSLRAVMVSISLSVPGSRVLVGWADEDVAVEFADDKG